MAGEWLWPTSSNTRISSEFGPRWGTKHNGIDIVSDKVGDSVLATRSGVVTRAEYSESYGYVVYIDHGDGYSSRYAHMDRELRVVKGQKVEKGLVIGRIGSTGDSQGPHLHFEILLNNVAQNPSNYVSISNDVTPPSVESIPLDTPNGDATGTYVADHVSHYSEEVTSLRVSDITKIPARTFLNIYVGNELLATYPNKPNIIIDFEISRIKGTGDKASFTLFDDNYDQIEYILSRNWRNIYIQYGYAESNIVSAKYHMLLMNYSIDFNNTGTLLTISAISQSAYDNLELSNIENMSTYNPTEAVKSICRGMGWVVKDENFDSSFDVERYEPYDVVNTYPVSYIKEVIIPEATENGEIFEFYVDSESVCYFKKVTYNRVNNDTVRTYVYQKGYDSVVKEISFDIKGVFGGTSQLYMNPQVATGAVSSSYLPHDKSKITGKEDYDSVTTDAPGDMSHTENQSTAIIDSSGYTSNQMSNRLYYLIKNGANSQYEATMTIIGDPTISLFDYVRIINLTDEGNLHHTSGIYFIKGITDTLSNGELTTILKLQRSADINDGIKYINPRAIIK